MMECTDRHFRYFLRLISEHAVLYTEMITTGAVLHGDVSDLLQFDPLEHPVALQLGGSDPRDMAQCARLGEQAGYDEININVGCPSDRVQSGRFGARLMANPGLVAACLAEMGAAVCIPITVKTRIGIDHQDSYEALTQFVSSIARAGCTTVIVHARKAWLKGLSPKQNREVPPLRYEVVHRLKRDYPHLEIILNGGLTALAQARSHLAHVDGVMIGREAYRKPYLLAEVDQLFYGDDHLVPTRREVLSRYLPYLETQLTQGVPLSRMTRHIMGLFQGLRGARAWRRLLSEQAHRPGAGVALIERAAQRIIESELIAHAS